MPHDWIACVGGGYISLTSVDAITTEDVDPDIKFWENNLTFHVNGARFKVSVAKMFRPGAGKEDNLENRILEMLEYISWRRVKMYNY